MPVNGLIRGATGPPPARTLLLASATKKEENLGGVYLAPRKPARQSGRTCPEYQVFTGGLRSGVSRRLWSTHCLCNTWPTGTTPAPFTVKVNPESGQERADIDGGGGDGKIQRMARESKVRGASKEALSPDSGSVAAKEWERKAERKGNLAEFLAASPLGVPVSQSMLGEMRNVRIDRPASGR
jgi:hypothetical protein